MCIRDSSTAASSAAAAADVTIKVAAIETGYGADMWKKVAEAFTAQLSLIHIFIYSMLDFIHTDR